MYGESVAGLGLLLIDNGRSALMHVMGAKEVPRTAQLGCFQCTLPCLLAELFYCSRVHPTVNAPVRRVRCQRMHVKRFQAACCAMSTGAMLTDCKHDSLVLTIPAGIKCERQSNATKSDTALKPAALISVQPSGKTYGLD